MSAHVSGQTYKISRGLNTEKCDLSFLMVFIKVVLNGSACLFSDSFMSTTDKDCRRRQRIYLSPRIQPPNRSSFSPLKGKVHIDLWKVSNEGERMVWKVAGTGNCCEPFMEPMDQPLYYIGLFVFQAYFISLKTPITDYHWFRHHSGVLFKMSFAAYYLYIPHNVFGSNDVQDLTCSVLLVCRIIYYQCVLLCSTSEEHCTTYLIVITAYNQLEHQQVFSSRPIHIYSLEVFSLFYISFWFNLYISFTQSICVRIVAQGITSSFFLFIIFYTHFFFSLCLSRTEKDIMYLFPPFRERKQMGGLHSD